MSHLVGRPDVIDKLQDIKDALGWHNVSSPDAEFIIVELMNVIDILKDEFQKTKDRNCST